MHFLTAFPAALVLFSLISAVFAQDSTPRKPSAPYEIGTPFPDLVLPRLSDGAPASVADFRGKRLLLQIFASW